MSRRRRGGTGAGPGAARRPDYARLRAALRQLAEVLNELHAQGRLHRDIKPSNVLVSRQGRLVLLDFGLSTDVEARANPETTDGHIVGTATYMAPEQAAGCPVTAASDWYAVGVMLYRGYDGPLAARGQGPGNPDGEAAERPAACPRTICEDVPEELDRLCMAISRARPAQAPPGGRDSASGSGAWPEIHRGTAEKRRLFVGRELQLSALRSAFADMCQGKTVAVFVHGRSGVGKSSLIQRFLEGLFERGEAVILAGRCYEQESVAYKAVDTLIDSLSRYMRRLSRREADALIPRDVSTLARFFRCCAGSRQWPRPRYGPRSCRTSSSSTAGVCRASRAFGADRGPPAAGTCRRRSAVG